MDSHPATFSDWTAHLWLAWGLEPTGLTHRTPLRLVATTRSGHVAVFSGAGTTLRLQLFPPSAVVTVVLRPECDCGEPHSDKALRRVQLDPSAVALWQGAVDGRRRYGWRGIDAAVVPVARAAAVLDELLRLAWADVPHTLALAGLPPVPGRTRDGSVTVQSSPRVASAA